MDKKKCMDKAIKISIVSIVVNLLLSLGKLLAGLFGNSQALVADAVHSASDVLTTVVVVVSLIIASRSADSNHEYGHQKYENLATLLLAILLGHVGIKIGYDGLQSIITGAYKEAAVPGIITIIAAAASIVVKEAMFHITMKVAKSENSNALKADAWHHRSDALSSIGSLAGVLFAMFGLPIMDPIASLVICVFIMKTAVEICIEAIKGLTDSACDKKMEGEIREKILSIEGVVAIDSLKTRIFGSGYYVDVEIQADKNISFEKSHEIAENVHDEIEKSFTNVWHCMVHANPSEE